MAYMWRSKMTSAPVQSAQDRELIEQLQFAIDHTGEHGIRWPVLILLKRSRNALIAYAGEVAARDYDIAELIRSATLSSSLDAQSIPTKERGPDHPILARDDLVERLRSMAKVFRLTEDENFP